VREKAFNILTTLFLAEAQRIGNSYAHQLSGGQRQRVLIAQAIACGPSLVIADEPTASLDPSTQQEILALLQALRKQLNLAMVLISHSPAVLAGLADRILVLYAGRVAETGPAEEVLTSPQHPYTQALLACLPPSILSSSARKNKLPVVGGEPPNLGQPAKGCRFEPRCTERMGTCTEKEPAQTVLSKNHCVSCFKYGG
jgi:oligopeptide/dipeptide ABC transporter ATP-binding protein